MNEYTVLKATSSGYLLGIESSCDDTGAAVCLNGKIISNNVANQTIHKKYGGVVPELASRAHQQNIIPVVMESLSQAGIGFGELGAVAVTTGPGLMGALLVGTSFAKAFAMGLKVPLIQVNHLQGHVLSLFIDDPTPPFPFLCLLVSGGHTLLMRVNDYFSMEILGRTTDDAAGEAFDKAAKILGLDYPGGVLIDQLAASGNPLAFSFPQPRVAGLDFSFSGLKTSFLYFVEKKVREDPHFIINNRPDLAASIQYSIVRYLVGNLIKAAKRTGITHVALSGGVSANRGLRQTLDHEALRLGWSTYYPAPRYCTDNAAMIALAGYYKWIKGEITSQEVVPHARMDL